MITQKNQVLMDYQKTHIESKYKLISQNGLFQNYQTTHSTKYQHNLAPQSLTNQQQINNKSLQKLQKYYLQSKYHQPKVSKKQNIHHHNTQQKNTANLPQPQSSIHKIQMKNQSEESLHVTETKEAQEQLRQSNQSYEGKLSIIGNRGISKKQKGRKRGNARLQSKYLKKSKNRKGSAFGARTESFLCLSSFLSSVGYRLDISGQQIQKDISVLVKCK